MFWGVYDENKEIEVLRDFEPFVDGNKFDEEAANNAQEEMEFTYGDSNVVTNDLVVLKTLKTTEKLAVSSAVAQSCKLSVHEWRLQQTINRNNHIPSQLAEQGFIDMKAGEISREIGKLFVEKNLINLEPSLLE